MSLTTIEECVSKVVVRPGGTDLWIVSAKPLGKRLRVLATQTQSRDAWSFDWDADVDTWSAEADGGIQVSSRTVRWPRSEDELLHRVIELLTQLAAHEMMEWTRMSGETVHNPHIHGDVTVWVPRRKRRG